GPAQRRAAGAVCTARDPDHRHRAELHPDPARRIQGSAAERSRCRSRRGPGIHDRRVPGEARQRGRARDRLEGEHRPGGLLPRPLPPEGAHRGRPLDGNPEGGGVPSRRKRRRLLRDGRIVRLRDRALRGLEEDRRGAAVPGDRGDRDGCPDQRRRSFLPSADRALLRALHPPHRRGAGVPGCTGASLVSATGVRHRWRRRHAGRAAGPRPSDDGADRRGDRPCRKPVRRPGL
ncbi:MAG: Fe-S protein, homolog of lactate dehydrogenase SO1521, partial [uncultured Thermomicrobiales bacterium]